MILSGGEVLICKLTWYLFLIIEIELKLRIGKGSCFDYK